MSNQGEITVKLPREAAREALQWIYAHLEDMTIPANDPDAEPKGRDRDEYVAMARAFNLIAAAYREHYDDLNIRSFWPEDPDELPDR